jgi:ABC-type antimicrobial peptide transport system permease subunit
MPCATIVGVVENITRGGIKEEPSMQFYLPKSQWPTRYSQAMVVRTQPGKGEQLIGPVRRAIQGVASEIPFPRVATYEQLHAPELRSWRLGATMFTLFGALALVVSVVGLYGLLAYSVAQRQQEFGIRTALGAQQLDIVAIVLKNGVALVTAGLAMGLAAAWFTATYVGPMLYKVESRDLVVYAGCAVLMMLATLATATIPARRAAGALPTIGLRSEG